MDLESSDIEIGLTPLEQTTVDTYNAIAAEWASAHSDVNFWGNELAIFRNHFFNNGSVLEACVGGGRDIKYLDEFTRQYTGIDVSDGLLLVAQSNNPDADLVQVQDLRQLPFSDDTFDGFWSSATLLHVPKDRIQEVLESLHRVTKKDGIGFISIKEGIGGYMEEVGTAGLRRLFEYYSYEEFAKILNACGYEIVGSTYRPLSDRTTFISYFVRVIK
ncbi:MAG: hypothetical protein QG570_88 [Patescibacteria group bacterium]|nr:hypothetical protein [Patescibacteria group bacterium]